MIKETPEEALIRLLKEAGARFIDSKNGIPIDNEENRLPKK